MDSYRGQMNVDDMMNTCEIACRSENCELMARSKKIYQEPSAAMPPGSSDDRSFLTKLCLGEGPLWLNCVTWPFVLFFNAFWIYVFPCLGVLIGRFTRLVCYPFCQCCWVYTDKSFEGEAAIGYATRRSNPVPWQSRSLC